MFCERHRSHQGAYCKQTATKANQTGADAKHQCGLQRCGEDHAGECKDADYRTEACQSYWICAAAERLRCKQKRGQHAAGEDRGQPRGRRDAQAEDLAAIGLQ